MEIKEQYRTIKNEDFVAMENHIAELERFRYANRIQVDIKVSDRRYRRMGSLGYPTGEYIAHEVIFSEIIGADVAGLYEPISKALEKEFNSAMINNQGAIDGIREEHAEMKAKLTGPVKCRCCQFEGQPSDLKEEENGELIKCPKCEEILMDFRGGSFIVQNIEAQSVSIF